MPGALTQVTLADGSVQSSDVWTQQIRLLITCKHCRHSVLKIRLGKKKKIHLQSEQGFSLPSLQILLSLSHTCTQSGCLVFKAGTDMTICGLSTVQKSCRGENDTETVENIEMRWKTQRVEWWERGLLKYKKKNYKKVEARKESEWVKEHLWRVIKHFARTHVQFAHVFTVSTLFHLLHRQPFAYGSLTRFSPVL